jgi:hypothetical protein
MREQWKQGLQWGGVAWLAYIVAHAVPDAVTSGRGVDVALAGGWVLSAILLLTGARGARLALGCAILAQLVTGTMHAASYPGDMHVAWALTFWLPMTLPLVPLLIMTPERPRLTIALALVGRWRDAHATLAGWRWPLVAYVVVMTNRAVWDLLRHVAQDQVSSFYRAPVFELMLLVVAALPRERATSAA